MSWLNAGGDQGQPEGLGAGGAANGERGSGEGGNLTLHGLDLGAENETLRIAHASDGGEHFFADAVVLAAQVQQRNEFERGGAWG